MLFTKPLLKKILIATYVTGWLMALLPSAATYAAGEKFSWVDKYTITATGGRISGTATFTDNLGILNNSPTGTLSSEFADSGNCTMNAEIKPSANGNSGVFDFNVTGSSTTTCGTQVQKQYSTGTVSIANSGNRNKVKIVTGSAGISSRPVSSIASNGDLSAAPATDTITLKNKDSGVTITTQTPAAAFDGTLYYQATFNGLPSATSGGNTINYQACSTVANNCSVVFSITTTNLQQYSILGKNAIIQGSSTAVSVASCDAGPGGLTWIVCGVINSVRPAIDFLKDQVLKQLQFAPIGTDTGSPTYKVWSSFRNLADVLLIIVFFVIIFGTSIGLDNYTVKRVLPRVIAAAILIQFSYLIIGVGNDMVNVFSAGLGQLAAAALGGGNGTSLSWSQGVFSGVLGIGAAAAGVGFIVLAEMWLPALLAVVSAAIGLFTTLVTLQIRQMLILALIVISPVAIALWILPNTERFFKLWRKQLFGLFLMYPLTVLLFVAADLFSRVIAGS